MGHSCLDKNWHVEAIGEGDLVTHQGGDALRVRGDKLCCVGTEAASADPHLLISPMANHLRMAVLEQRPVHFKNGVDVDGFGQGEGSLRGPDVANHQLGIPGCVYTELRQGDLHGRATARVLPVQTSPYPTHSNAYLLIHSYGTALVENFTCSHVYRWARFLTRRPFTMDDVVDRLCEDRTDTLSAGQILKACGTHHFERAKVSQ